MVHQAPIDTETETFSPITGRMFDAVGWCHGGTGHKLSAEGHLTPGAAAPGRPRRHRRAAPGAVSRPGDPQADPARLRARAAAGLPGLVGAAGAGAATRDLGARARGVQRARPARGAGPLPHADAVRERG